MTTDYRAMCAELASELEDWIDDYGINNPSNIHTIAADKMIERARALLAQPVAEGERRPCQSRRSAMTKQLPPAAQAVRRDLSQIMHELSQRCRVSISVTDTLPITLETNGASLQAGLDSLCAAALQAAADQVLPEEPLHGGDQRWTYERDTRQESRKKLLAIAAELEAQ